MVENTVYISEQVGTSVILSWYQTAILDRLPSKFMKVQMRIQELWFKIKAPGVTLDVAEFFRALLKLSRLNLILPNIFYFHHQN